MSLSTTFSEQHQSHVATQKLSLNLLNFNHPASEYTFWFSSSGGDDLSRVHKNLVPDEVKDNFGEQEHYYTSFDRQHVDFFPVTKSSAPVYPTNGKPNGEAKKQMILSAAFSKSLVRRYYNHRISSWFQTKKILVKPDFINDIEVWVNADTKNTQYWIFDKFLLKVQFAKITKKPELMVTYAGQSKIFRQNVAELISSVSPLCFNWVVNNRKMYRYDKLPEELKQNLEKVYPVWNFDLRDALKQETEAPDKTNKYYKFKSKINEFFNKYLNNPDFKAAIPIESTGFEIAPEMNINKVHENSNLMLFGNQKQDIAPIKGMKNGPFKTAEYSKIQFFYIFHTDDMEVTRKLDDYFKKGLYSFKGLYNFTRIPYFTKQNFSIIFNDKTNPLPEIEAAIHNREFNSGMHYMAIYVSPHSKTTRDKECKKVYYRVKELLLKKRITSQAVDAEKVRSAIDKKDRYDYSLNNIAIAILAKLNGIPWQLNTKPRKELVVGVGAFKSIETEVQYIGSAFCFTNNGKFNHFECFRKDQTDELAASIILQVRKYVSSNSDIKRLVIHFYKNMSKRELEPIEKGLNNLGLDIPVFIISVNKSESHDITAFDNNWENLMPISGTFIKIGFNRFILFNNTRYGVNGFNKSDGFPFPLKLSISCTDEELANDYQIIKDLIDQVYQFSRMYWKSVRQQSLPVTIKYPELVAEIYPHFYGNKIPDFGKDNLWFL